MRIGLYLQSSQPENGRKKPLPSGVHSKPLDYRQRHAEDEQVQRYIRSILNDVENRKIDRGAVTFPITPNRIVLEECYEKKGSDPGAQDGEYAVGAAAEARCDEDAFVEEDNGNFDAKDGEAVEELRDEQNLHK